MDLNRKAWFVYGGHLTDPPHAVTHSSVLSHDIVCTVLNVVLINDLDVRFLI